MPATQSRPKRPKPNHTAQKSGNGQTDSGQRLHKVLAAAGVASRRACEALIAKGSVVVNGQLVTTLPTWVNPETDRIEVDGHLIARTRARRPKKQYVLINKPRHVVSTCQDPEGRRCVTDLVDLPTRLFPVGRLDAESSGLMLLTNDGLLSSRLSHPRYEVAKQYQVSVRGHVNQTSLQALRKGIYLAHLKSLRAGNGDSAKRASAAEVKLIGYSRDRSHGERTNLLVTLREGQNREIRRMLARLGHKVRRLQRTAIGPINIKGLAVGQWRYLTGRETNMLYRVAGLAKNTRLEHLTT